MDLGEKGISLHGKEKGLSYYLGDLYLVDNLVYIQFSFVLMFACDIIICYIKQWLIMYKM